MGGKRVAKWGSLRELELSGAQRWQIRERERASAEAPPLVVEVGPVGQDAHEVAWWRCWASWGWDRAGKDRGLTAGAWGWVRALV